MLYFVEGAPIGYVWWALPTRLRAAEIPIAEITALSALLTIPWSAKFLWAPLVDAMRPRRAGLRGWIAGAQLVMGASLLPIVGLELDAGSLGTLSTFLLVHAFAAATQDVAIDALAIRHTPTDELGAISGWMQVGMLTGRAAFGGMALMIEQRIGASSVVLGLVALCFTGSILVWIVPEDVEPVAGRIAERLGRFAKLLGTALASRSTWLGLLLASLAGAGMESLGVVAGPMLIDLGLPSGSVGGFFAGPAVVGMAVGALLGGRLADARARDGRERIVAGCIVALALGIVATAFVLPLPGATRIAIPILAVDYVLFGLFTASIYSLFMQITDPRLGATQFSTFMGGINLCSVWSAWAVGRLAASWGYPSALTTLALASTAALPLLYAIRASRSQSTDP
ncbi:MAG: MFS transporter [Myxococcota bacterium]